jgi:hypothetical protein
VEKIAEAWYIFTRDVYHCRHHAVSKSWCEIMCTFVALMMMEASAEMRRVLAGMRREKKLVAGFNMMSLEWWLQTAPRPHIIS